MPQSQIPFCSAPWTSLYVQWDGKLTRPCIRGPQDLGDISNVDMLEFWNGPSYQTLRRQVRDECDLSEPCAGCHAKRELLIDYVTPYADNIESYDLDKIDNYYHAMGQHEGGKLIAENFPLALILDLSSKCHLRCPKCFVYNSNMQYQLGHMSMETFNKLVPLLKYALQVVGHENGESMLNKNFLEMVRIIKENGCRFLFNTTGQLLDRAKSEKLVEYDVDHIMFSIDSINSDTYERLHKGATLDKLFKNLHDLNAAKVEAGKSKPMLGWYFVASKSNLHELPHIIEKAAELGFHSMYISHLNSPSREQWRSYFDFYRAENLRKNPDDHKQLVETFTQARIQAESNNIRFYCGQV